MLSKQAFNALLKTLEEPPEHVKFIFATTEIRKVPITVLSRCQRFDLRRVDVPTLTPHFLKICEAEGVKAEDEAIALIARAADGSVRDGLSLLDQAIALGGDTISGAQVQDMLGLADRARGLDLLEYALSGNMPAALEIMTELYSAGADPVVVIQDLLDLSHLLTKLRAVPDAKDMKESLAADSVARAADLAGKLSMPTLGKTWQLLLKGVSEVRGAPNPQSAAEMVVIRLTYAADLPDPAALIKKLKDMPEGASPNGGVPMGASSDAPGTQPPGASASSHPTGAQPSSALPPAHAAPSSSSLPQSSMQPSSNQGAPSMSGMSAAPAAASSGAQNAPRAALAIVPESEPFQCPEIRTLDDVITVLEHEREVVLAGQVYQYVHLVKLEPGLLEIRPEEQASPKFTQDLGAQLSRITGTRWIVSVSSAPGQPTLAQQAQAVIDAERNAVLNLPIIKDVLAIFPEAELADITDIKQDTEDETPQDANP